MPSIFKIKAIVFIIHNLKLYHKSIATQIACYCHKDRHMNQKNRIENPEINADSYNDLICDQTIKSIH